MTLPRRAPCSSRQAQAYVEKEMDYFKQEMEEAQTQRENDNKNGETRKRKTSLFSGVSGGKRLNQHASSVLFGWLEEHMENPYPTKQEKATLQKAAKITQVQLRNWFTNVRKRHFRPTLQKGRPPRSALDLAIQTQGNKVQLLETHNRKKRSHNAAPQNHPPTLRSEGIEL